MTEWTFAQQWPPLQTLAQVQANAQASLEEDPAESVAIEAEPDAPPAETLTAPAEAVATQQTAIGVATQAPPATLTALAPRSSISVSFLLLAVLLILVMLLPFVVIIRRQLKTAPAASGTILRCHCGYDLRGSIKAKKDNCPECGRAIVE